MHNKIKLKDLSDILILLKELTANEKILDETLFEISQLERGNVKPEDTLRRSEIGSIFSSSIQQINNCLFKNKISISKNRKEVINRLGYKADKILRENIVLQTKPPLDVVKFKNVPIRFSYSTFGRKEQRWGYGLHMKPFNEEGDSITVALMPPQYTQSIHNHKISEYCLVIDSKTEGIFFPGGKREKIYTTNISQILHFSATTPHTLRNPLKKYSRNITFKHSTALTDWRPASKLNKVKTIRARVIKSQLNRIDSSQTRKFFEIDDRYYKYKIEIIRLQKNTNYKNIHNYDQYIFVMNGRLTINHKNIKKNCQKNDFIVIDKNTEYTIKTDTFCRLYTIIR